MIPARFFLVLIFAGGTVCGQAGWWKTEPLRLIQTNLRETDSSLDAARLVEELSAFPANTLLFSVGGIVAHYPTRVEFHYPSRHLPSGSDLVGNVIERAHRKGIRVIGRFDFSRARREVFEAHPEWFFLSAEGEPVVDDNQLYSSCINGGYYNEKAMEILAEALERYPVDGLFFNWFGNLRTDYKGNDIGLCNCSECTARFQQKYGRPIPRETDREYAEFMFESSREVARKIRDLIKQKRPEALFMTYIQEYTDGIVSEADFYKWRPLPQWIYSASENVNRALNTRPEKTPFDLVMPYQEMRYRFAGVPGEGLRALLYQNMAHGAFPAFVLLGTFDQPDRTAQLAVRPVFQWHAEHEDLLNGQESAARVILYARQDRTWSSHSPDYRGFFRLLTELHVPFRVTDKLDGRSAKDTDLVVVPEGPIPATAQSFLEGGGSLLVAGTQHPGLGLPASTRLWTNTLSSYMRIESHRFLPSLQNTSVLFWEGEYLELEPDPRAALTLIPPSQFGPPDKVSTLSERTNKPGLIVQRRGKGRVAFIPWNIGRLYYLFANDKHRAFVSDLIDHLLPDSRQLVTDAHPQIEITVMKNGDRLLLHLVNLLGHSGTAFFEAPKLDAIGIRVKGTFSRARALRLKADLPSTTADGLTALGLPSLEEYEVIVLE